MKIHLSHTDLDGYTCQFITSILDYTYMNADYGESLNHALGKIMAMANVEEILITDLNLKLCQAEKIHLHCMRNNIELQLLDHHASGKDASIYEWYHLDTTKSATKLTHEWMVSQGHIYGETPAYVEVVNAYDIFLKNVYFQYGVIVNDFLNRYMAHDLYHFEEYRRTKAFQLLHITMMADFDYETNNYLLFESIIDDELRELTGGSLSSVDYNVMLQKSNLVNENHIKFDTTPSESYLGMLLLGSGGTSWSLLADKILEDENIEFVIRVKKSGSVSIRSTNKVSSIDIAKSISATGGGHPKAGGSFNKDLVYGIANDEAIYTVAEKLGILFGNITISELSTIGDVECNKGD